MTYFVKYNFMTLAKLRELNLFLKWSDFKIFKMYKKLGPCSFYKYC
jgi:hypothetical protein